MRSIAAVVPAGQRNQSTAAVAGIVVAAYAFATERVASGLLAGADLLVAGAVGAVAAKSDYCLAVTVIAAGVVPAKLVATFAAVEVVATAVAYSSCPLRSLPDLDHMIATCL